MIFSRFTKDFAVYAVLIRKIDPLIKVGQLVLCSVTRKLFRFTYSLKAQCPLWPSWKEPDVFENFLFQSHQRVLIFFFFFVHIAHDGTCVITIHASICFAIIS